MAVAGILALLLTPTAAAASSGVERRAAAVTAARLTLDYGRARTAAGPRADATAAARRAAARPCLDVWRAVPAARRELAGSFYFTTIVAARWSVDGPLTERWVARLASSRAIARVPLLAAAVRALDRSTQTFTRLHAATPDACPAMRRWQAAGFTAATAPAPELQDAPAFSAFDRDQAVIDRGTRTVARHGGVRGEAAAELMRGALDEADELVIDDCDPVARVVLPDSVDPCTP